MNNVAEDQILEEIRNTIEDYEGTIQAGQSFISIVTWDNSQKLNTAKYSWGRKMKSSKDNLISPDCVLTPDIVIQRQKDLGYVVEVKKSLPMDKREWEEVSDQIIKYDDELIGWWDSKNEKISFPCIVLLIHISRSRDFTDFFLEYLKTKNIHLKNCFSIIEFTRADERIHYYLLRKQFGEIQDTEINNRLYSGISVPIEKVVVSYGNQKFYDSEPPCVEYTMAILWQDIFNSMRGQSFDKKMKAYPIDVSIHSLTDEIQKLYGAKSSSSRDVEFPTISWIKRAMDTFVNMNHAEKFDDDKYRVYFKLLREDPISYFAKHIRDNNTDKQNPSSQLPLFN